MDFDTYLGYNEEEAYEDQYAEEMKMLNDLEGLPKPNTDTSSSSQTHNHSSNESSKKKLFDDAGPSHCSENHLLNNGFENDLIIDEELFETSPKRKRLKMDIGFEKKHNLPTTLDEDREAFEMRQKQRNTSNMPDSPAMIERILRYRENKIKDIDNKEFLNKDIHNSTQTSRLQLTKVLVRPPVYCDFISSTSSDGDRFYMRIHPEEELYKDQNFQDIKSKNLLPRSISEMRQEIHLMRENKILSESHRLTEQIRRQNVGIINEGDLSNDVTNSSSARNDSMSQDAQRMTEAVMDTDEGEDENTRHALWLNKYAPTQYTHLLSDESVNRALLKWLKMWDHVVFGRELPQKKVNKNPEEIKKQAYGFKKTFQHNNFEDKFDDYNRPHWKIVLLYGPPGLGKTTLAHIIAKHAGYHVVEMNASDDRSAEAFRNKLEETTQMRSVLGYDQRPNCLIIDEIDGAPVAAINVLLAAVNMVKKGKQAGTRKKRAQNNILLRPVICICNDLYAPALRQLRQHSLLLQFPPTQTARLASRLTQLCRLQQLQCDLTSLLTLCEKAENDIRSCINTLQFLKSCGTTKLDIHAIKNMNVGQKDQHKSIFNVWQEIFQLPKTKRKMEKNAEAVQLDSQLSQQKLTVLATRFYTIYHVVLSNGEYDKTLQGVYENFLKMKFKDHDLACLNKAQEWLQFQDVQSTFITRHQDWTVMKFSPFIFVLFHMLFACVSVPRITFPTQKFENTKRVQNCANLLESMYSDMFPIARCFMHTRAAILDSIPYILEIMVPSIRPVNTQLFSPAEKKLVKDLVNTMLAYNLTYRQERNEDGQYKYVLEPNVAEICFFSGTHEHRKLSYATMQMISKEVETERIRRSEHIMEVSVRHVEPKSMHEKPKPVDKPIEKSKPQPEKDSTPNHLQRLDKNISNASHSKEKPVFDFFSKFKKVRKVVLIGENGDRNERKKQIVRDPGIGNSAIWFKFNEGISNAVRQTVKVKYFM